MKLTGSMAKRPLSVELRPSSAVIEYQPTDDVTAMQRRRLSMNDISQLTSSSSSSSAADEAGCRLRDSPTPISGCKRHLAAGLPRLNLTLIQESGTWAEPACAISDTQSRDPAVSTSGAGPSCMTSSLSGTATVNNVDVPCSSASSSAVTSSITSSSSTSSLWAGSSDTLTNILPFLYLGSQRDALSADVISTNGIEYIINVSATSPQCPFVSESKFLRIPVNDGHSDRLLPFFSDAFHFLDEVRKSSGRVLVHCLAGISRSPTLVIAYVMQHLRLSIDDAYRFVKQRRPAISPNFNFLGQLVEYDSMLTAQRDVIKASDVTKVKADCDGSPNDQRAPSPSKRPCMVNLSWPSSAETTRQTVAQSPTSALSRLQFDSTAERRLTPSCAPPTDDVTSGTVRRGVSDQSQTSKISTSCSSPIVTSLKAATAGDVTSDTLLLQLQTACKSRSLEDILLSSRDVTNVAMSRSRDVGGSMTSLGSGSGGAGNSLRGSVEIIQVS